MSILQSKQIGRMVGVTAATAVICFSSVVEAGDTYFKVSSGNWTDTTSWTGVVPALTTDAPYIGCTTGAGVSPATCALNAPAQQCGTLRLGYNASDRGELNITAGDLTLGGYVYVGVSGTGFISQSDGVCFYNENRLILGSAAGSHGTYDLTGGVMTNVTFVWIGDSGEGTFNLSGSGAFHRGNYHSTYKTYVGNQSGSRGVVNQTGGVWNQNANGVALGNSAGSEGTYNLSGGTLKNMYYLNVGVSGKGTFNLSNTGELHRVAFDPTYSTIVGQQAGSTGVVNQTGGLWENDANKLLLGNLSGSDGTYNLSGGTLRNTRVCTIGDAGKGTFNLSGNGKVYRVLTHSTYDTTIGNAAGSIGMANQTGGLWDNGGNEILIANAAGSAGIYTISGGTLTNVSNFMNPQSGTGTFSISGSSASMYVGAYIENQTTATLRVHPDAGGLSPINVSGAITLKGTLEVDFSNYKGKAPVTIIAHGGTRTGTFAALNILTEGCSAEIEYNDAVVPRTVRLINIVNPNKDATVISFH